MTTTATISRSGRVCLALVTLAVVAACAERRPYTAPRLEPTELRQADPSTFAWQAYDPQWWRQFEDPVLEQLQQRALAANHDVRMAVARVEQARAVFDDSKRDRFPTVTVGAAVERREQVIPGFTEEPVSTSTYRAGFDAAWELDVFGRVRSAVRAAAATAEAEAATLDAVRVSVAAEVARNYFELRGLQQRRDVAARSLANLQETLRLTRVRRDAGVGEEQDVASAAARVAAVDAVLPPIDAAITARVHRLAVLTGVRPGELDVDLAPRAYPALGRTLALGDPTTLLRRRPDVRAAERRLAAATALEGVAAASLYPRITVTGVLGFLAGRGSMFGDTDARQWAVTPSLNWAAFDLGRARARLRGSEAATAESLAAFEQAVLVALEETENALAGYRAQQQRVVRLADQARESSRAAAIARLRYREGLADFLELLDAERTELQAKDAVAEAESGAFVAVVAVYKSLGGIVG